MDKLVDLKSLLIEPFYFYLFEKGRKHIISKCLKKKIEIKNLAEGAGCSLETLNQILEGKTKYGRRFVGARVLRNLLKIAEISPEEIEQYICAIRRGKNTRPVEMHLPIKPSPNLSLLFAKAIGDGCVCSDWRFNYKNNQIDLINEVITAVENSIGSSKSTLHKRNKSDMDLKLSPVIGYILHHIGVPKSYKINQKAKIPLWITAGNAEIKQTFLKGIFDDESCVDPKGKRIVIAFGKSKRLQTSLIAFLDSIRNMLSEFGVNTSRITFQQEHNNTRMFRFGIYGKENFINYQKYIGFSHPQKSMRLNNLLESYIDIQKTQKKILQTVISSDVPLTVSQISKITDTKTKAALYHLLNLARKGKINKTYGCSPTLWANPNKLLINNKDKILRVLADSKLSAFEISDILNLDIKYTFQMLKSLKNAGLLMCNDSHPKIWKLHKLP